MELMEKIVKNELFKNSLILLADQILNFLQNILTNNFKIINNSQLISYLKLQNKTDFDFSPWNL